MGRTILLAKWKGSPSIKEVPTCYMPPNLKLPQRGLTSVLSLKMVISSNAQLCSIQDARRIYHPVRLNNQIVMRTIAPSASRIPTVCFGAIFSFKMIHASSTVEAGYNELSTAATSNLP